MKKIFALGMLGLVFAAAFALGTSATFRDYRVQRSVHIAVVPDDSELIDLTPVQPYAYLNDGGQLVIDFSMNNPNWPGHENESWATYQGELDGYTGRGIGLSPQSRYNFDEVFNVSNHLWEGEPIVVEVTSSNAGMVSFYNPDGMMYNTNGGGVPYNSDTAVGDVCFYLAPGEALGVGMELAAPNTLGSYDVDINVQAWPASDAPFTCGGG
ncbi:hypothetical protein A3L12_03305 [Thermococcus sp. P6]|uniref:DUF1102 domain-containing protein n=1 Tax=Thermococcus sp. P6 TaxID=122420 RepID=UPI000B5A0C26|nr:DUF1102 domain-containing protein [Thermococcus sp. P6]ASJ10395.1 hypothetical protein A3L12_03305 [Thermococcus sp. P6]